MSSSPQPFRFGVQAFKADSGRSWTELARKVESLGYSSMTMPDHFSDLFAPVPGLTAAAAVTTTLRVGALVWDNDYKHPLVLAKELATMDVLSEGRLEIGLGAGWEEADYVQSGIPYDPPGVRVDRFIEGLAVIKGVLSGDPFSFSGLHYTITNHTGTPLPVQRPHPPVLIGGGGKRVLGIAAREADIVGINSTLTAGHVGAEALASMTADAVDSKVAIARAAANAAGRNPDTDIEWNIRTFMVHVTDDRAGVVGQLSALSNMSHAEIEASPFALVGSPARIVDDLLARRERWGFSYIIIGANEVEQFAPVVAELAGK
jgi:probable F420-dependent oxidoreductase